MIPKLLLAFKMKGSSAFNLENAVSAVWGTHFDHKDMSILKSTLSLRLGGACRLGWAGVTRSGFGGRAATHTPFGLKAQYSQIRHKGWKR